MSSLGNLYDIFGQSFNPADVKPQEDFEVLPPGKYPVLIEAAEIKQTKAGNGHYLKLTMSIIEGPYRNRKIWDQINIQNPSKECVEIGLRSLSAIGRALGLSAIKDTSQLLDKTCVAHVKVKGEQNQVRTYSALSQGPPITFPYTNLPLSSAPVTNSPQKVFNPNPTPPANNSGKPPWMN